MREITAQEGISRLVDFCGDEGYSIATKDPVAKPFEDDVLTVNIKSNESSTSIGARGGFETRNGSSDFGDKYFVSEQYANQTIAVSEGSLIQQLYNFKLIKPDEKIEFSEMVFSGEHLYRPDGLRKRFS